MDRININIDWIHYDEGTILMRKTNKELVEYYKTKERHWIEAYVDCHNRLFELIRTIASCCAFVLQICILLKVFGIWK